MPIYVNNDLSKEIAEPIVVCMGKGDVGIVPLVSKATGVLDELHFCNSVDNVEHEIGAQIPYGVELKSKVVLTFDNVLSVDVLLEQLIKIKYALLNNQFNFIEKV